MNQLLLSPTDVLFFRDGRPMGGSSAGHGEAWPLPNVTNAALHAALWRSGLAATARPHQRKINHQRSGGGGERFGSLLTAGPFPVCIKGDAHTWFFPRPFDAECSPTLNAEGSQNGQGTLRSLAAPTAPLPGATSSNPLALAVAAIVPPTKDTPAPWWSEGAWNTYLGTAQRNDLAARLFTKSDSAFSDREAYIGIGIDPGTGTQDGERLYSAHYLRLHDGWALGVFAATGDKYDDPALHGERQDLIPDLITQGHLLLVGGQQRLCTATCDKPTTRLPFPLGKTDGFALATLPALGHEQPQHLVKWVLLSPAIFPALPDATPAHTGGWLPNWIHPITHAIQLRAPAEPRDLKHESRDAYRARVQQQSFIKAQLVAAQVGKPLPVTGWSLGTPDNPEGVSRAGGAKSTHLAVPAGSVYYFACASAEAAAQLAAALNWHGAEQNPTTIRNRRSTLLGEKGFGLGVCGTWTPHASA
jgi:hypothetical protein